MFYLMIQPASSPDVLMHDYTPTTSLFRVLKHFRTESVAVTVDVQQMFLFIVYPDNLSLIEFLWYHNNIIKDEVMECRMQLHVSCYAPGFVWT